MDEKVKIFNEAMELACLGLFEKKQFKENEGNFKYSPMLKKSLDKFSLLNYEYDTLTSEYNHKLFPTNETELIKTLSYDIEMLIEKIPIELQGDFKSTEWYKEEALVSLGSDNSYYCTESLLDLINDDRKFRKSKGTKHKERELNSQKFIGLLFDRSQEEYCEIRLFLEQKKHSHITRTMLLAEEYIMIFKKKYPEIFEEAYVKLNYVPSYVKLCNHCGLVLKELADGTLYCVSERCSKKSKGFTKYKEEEVKEEVWVLKDNVARYIYYPGILEQEILNILKKLNIQYTLWPKHDTWDFQFQYKGQDWVVDAKDVKNPEHIIRDIETKEKEKHDKIIYVIPSDKRKTYLDAIRRSIVSKNKIECMTIASFRKLFQGRE